METTLGKVFSLLREVQPTIVQTICYTGLIGNFLSAIVLTRPQMRNTHLNILLLGLTFSDALYLSGSLFRVAEYAQKLDPYGIIGWHGWFFGQSTSIYLTVAISIERLIIIYYPFRARTLFTISTSKWILAFVISISLLTCLPDFLFPSMSSNETFMSFYSKYWTWIFPLVQLHIPFFSLLILNILIYTKLRQAAKERARLRNQEDESANERNSNTRILVCVVLIFGICYSFQFPRDIFYYWWTYSDSPDSDIDSYYKIWRIFVFLNDITTSVNSSANFIIYILMGKKFRNEFYQIFFKVFKCSKCHRRPQSEIIALDALRTI